MKAVVRAKKIGGSIMVRVPKEIVQEEAIREGTLLEIDVSRPKKDFFGALKGIGSFTKEDELDTHE